MLDFKLQRYGLQNGLKIAKGVTKCEETTNCNGTGDTL